MKPAPFEYHKATTLEEALSLLAEYGDDAKILAGGQSLVPLMKLRLARPEILIDINGVGSLARVTEEADALKIGALVRHSALEEHGLVKQLCPLLSHAAGVIGHRQVRHRGTFGGSLCHADPCAELPIALVALDGTITVVGTDHQERDIPASEFFLTYLTTTLLDTEVLIHARVPRLPNGTGWGFAEFSDTEGSVAVICVAVLVKMGLGGECERASVCVGGVSDTPVRLTEVEQFLAGKEPDPKQVDEASQLAASTVQPEPDMLHSALHKKALVANLTHSAVEEAFERTKGDQKHGG